MNVYRLGIQHCYFRRNLHIYPYRMYYCLGGEAEDGNNDIWVI